MPDKVDTKMIIITILSGLCLFLMGFGTSQLAVVSQVKIHEVEISNNNQARIEADRALADADNRLSQRMNELIELVNTVVTQEKDMLTYFAAHR